MRQKRKNNRQTFPSLTKTHNYRLILLNKQITLFPFLELAVFVVSDSQCKGSKTPGGLSGSKQVTVITTMLLLLWLLCGLVCMAAQHAPLAHVQNILDIRVFATREYYHY